MEMINSMGTNSKSEYVMYCNGHPIGEFQDVTELIDSAETETISDEENARGIEDFFTQLTICCAETRGFAKALSKTYPKRILKSGRATIVFWMDGTKTIVKRSENEPDDDYAAFTAALGVKLFGSNSALKRLIERKTEVQRPKKQKEKAENPVIPIVSVADHIAKNANEIVAAFRKATTGETK